MAIELRPHGDTLDDPTYCIDENNNCRECHNHAVFARGEPVEIEVEGEVIPLEVARCRPYPICPVDSPACPEPFHVL